MAGNINFGYSGDGGAATKAFLDTPVTTFLDSSGNLYFPDQFNHAIRKISGVAPFAYGSVNVAASSNPQDVEVRNTGNTTLTLTSVAASTNFNLTGPHTTCSNSTNLAGGASCVIGVVFAPTTTGPLTGAVSFAADITAPQVPLSGTGLAGPTTTEFTAAPNPATAGHAVTLTATISPVPTASPLGSVFFCENGTSEPTVVQFIPNPRSARPGSPSITTPEETANPCGSGTLLGTVNVDSSGMAVLSISNLPVGAHNLTAVYSGNSSFLGSASSAVTETVGAGATSTSTTTTLTASPNPAPAGQTVTLTATISPAPTGSTLGTVNFNKGATLLGTSAVNSSGVATFTITSLPGGADAIIAVYSGNTAFGSSTSSALTETVTAAFTVAAPTAPVMATEGGSVAIAVTVPPLGGSFNNVVTMSATGLPRGATATFNPPTVTPGAAGAPTVLTIQLLSAPIASLPADQRQKTPFAPFSTAVALCCIALGYRRSAGRIIKRALVLASFFLVGTFLSACNGGLASKPGTLPGNYIVTITGTSGALQRSTTITLTVP